MTKKAYIVANEQQEREVLERLEREGFKWNNGARPTKIIQEVYEPITLFAGDDNKLTYAGGVIDEYLTNKEIVYDGRKEEQMSEKYVVSQEFMTALMEWKDTLDSNDYEYKPLVGWVNLKNLPETVSMWLGDDEVLDEENNNRLIAIIRWVNGQDVFEVEKPKKWIVRSKEVNDDGDKHYWKLLNLRGVLEITSTFELRLATKFDTKEEAESWANAHQEVLEVVDV